MSETAAGDWQAVADQLHDHGVPETRAKAVALVATGHTHQEAADILGYSDHGTVGTHIERYRNEDLPNARWLAEHGPEV